MSHGTAVILQSWKVGPLFQDQDGIHIAPSDPAIGQMYISSTLFSVILHA